MIASLLKPFSAVWRALVSLQRKRLADDPDIKHLVEQRHEAERANQRLNIVEAQYLNGGRHGR